MSGQQRPVPPPGADPWPPRDQQVSDVTSTHLVLAPGRGELSLPAALSGDATSSPALRALIERRLSRRADFHAPAIAPLLHRLRLGAPDRASEPGHWRWFPHGVLARRLISEWLEDFIVSEIGGAAIATPSLLRWSGTHLDGALEELAGPFRERIYTIVPSASEPELLLRYGGDPGFFALLRDARLEASQLPWRVYECVPGYRRNRSGELRGIQRTRSFEFFDCHSTCAGPEQGMAEYLRVLSAQSALLDSVGGDHAASLTLVEHDAGARAAVREWVDDTRRPVLVESTSRRRSYYRVLHNIYDERGLRTMHAQLDDVNGARWRPQDPAPLSIVHSATGTLERWLLVFLLNALDGSPPGWPTWLAPVQVRLLPVRETDVPRALELAARLRRRRVRVEVDDRGRTVGWRVRDGGLQWIPFLVVVGAQDTGDQLDVRLRGGDRGRMSEDGIVAAIGDASGGMPFRALPVRRLSAEPALS